MSPDQEFSLTAGGDCFLHFHSEDRRPTQDLLHGLQAIANSAVITGNTTLTGSEDFLRVDTSAGDVTITLPPSKVGTEITIIKTSPLHSLIVQGSGGETINGAATKSYTTQWSARVISSEIIGCTPGKFVYRKDNTATNVNKIIATMYGV